MNHTWSTKAYKNHSTNAMPQNYYKQPFVACDSVIPSQMSLRSVLMRSAWLMSDTATSSSSCDTTNRCGCGIAPKY